MMAFLMIMRAVLFEHFPEGIFPKQDEPRQDFLLHRSHPSLSVGIQIRTAWGKFDERESGRFDQLLKGRAEFSVTIVALST